MVAGGLQVFPRFKFGSSLEDLEMFSLDVLALVLMLQRSLHKPFVQLGAQLFIDQLTSVLVCACNDMFSFL